MGRWMFAACCVFGMVASAITLYSTNQTLQELKRVRSTHARPAVASRPRSITPGSAEVMGEPAAATAQPASTPSTETPARLNIKLLGTMLDNDPMKSSALLEDSLTGSRRMYTTGETVQRYQLVEVARGYVVLAFGDQRERVELEADATERETTEQLAATTEQPPAVAGADPPAPWATVLEPFLGPKHTLDVDEARTVKDAITPVSETERIVNRQAVWETLKGNPFPIAREAAILPVFASGHLAGFRLTTITSDGILQQSGFQPDDIIQSINGKPVTDPVAMLQVPAYLQSDEIRVQVDRHGQPVTLTFQLQ